MKVASYKFFTTNNNMSNKNYIECPLCHEHFQSLVRHIPYKHNLSMDEFRKQYPGFPVQIGKPKEDSIRAKREKLKEFYKKFWDDSTSKYKCPHCGKLISSISGLQEHCLSHGDKLKTYIEEENQNKDKSCYICEYCGEHFKDKRGLSVHLSMKHPNEWKALKRDSKIKEGYECPICHKIYIGLGDHIKATHHMDWDTFKKEYNWVLGKSYFSSSHRKNLSKNKKIFYETKRGLELRHQQSIHEGPYSKESFNDLFESSPLKNNNCRSYFFWKNNKLYCRSFTEYYIRCVLDNNNISYEYEGLTIKYVDNGIEREYHPDIIIGNNLYEIKDSEREFSSNPKYGWIYNSLKNTPYNLYLLTPKNLYEVIPDIKISFTKIDVYNSIYNNFWDDDSFIIGGKLNYNKNHNLKETLLRRIFRDEYTKFEEENNKRKLNYENCKYKEN